MERRAPLSYAVVRKMRSPQMIGEELPRDACVDYIFRRAHTQIDEEIRLKCIDCTLALNEPLGPHGVLASDHSGLEATFEMWAGQPGYHG